MEIFAYWPLEQYGRAGAKVPARLLDICNGGLEEARSVRFLTGATGYIGSAAAERRAR
ncbi:MAG: hypothetical protein AVDCRST_MAG93-4161 [uncultured Chloroflexia bacterium]|uniref:Uncharacterized protein n=1 Tax=uncultured Chloroflexia bacterium TaxID=1672391 RepID=A0A6J4K498_9CHLR|nr:MAG: hypothetical protein AVDCRST_MAG93-4161 [uncultured Chloroflexia bacterium]